MDKLCRFCGMNNPKSMPLFHTCNTDLLNNIEKFFPIKIKSTDLLPKLICPICTNKTYETTKFFRKILETEKRFTERLAKTIFKKVTPPTPPISIPANNVKKRKPTEVDPLSSESNAFQNSKSITVAEALKKIQSTSKGITIKKLGTAVPAKQPSPAKLVITNVESLNANIKNEIELVTCDELRVDEDVAAEASEPDVADDSQSDPDYVHEESGESDDPDFPSITEPRTSKRKTEVIVLKMDLPAAYVCMTCKGKFPAFEDLKEHMKNSMECKSVYLSCKHCRKVCSNRKSLYQHTLTHREKITHVCDKCGKGYTNKFNLENHKSSFHGEYCDEYGSIYKCKICEMQFSQRAELYAHVNTHANDKKVHLCETCGKSFNNAEGLRSHNRSHSDIRPYECKVPGCDKKYRSNILLIQHRHVHTGIKEFTCQQCDKTFAKKGSLTLHQRTHTGETPYHCKACNVKFNTPNKLKTHMKIHGQQI